jgi:hypothetical protein
MRIWCFGCFFTAVEDNYAQNPLVSPLKMLVQLLLSLDDEQNFYARSNISGTEHYEICQRIFHGMATDEPPGLAVLEGFTLKNGCWNRRGVTPIISIAQSSSFELVALENQIRNQRKPAIATIESTIQQLSSVRIGPNGQQYR